MSSLKKLANNCFQGDNTALVYNKYVYAGTEYFHVFAKVSLAIPAVFYFIFGSMIPSPRFFLNMIPFLKHDTVF